MSTSHINAKKGDFAKTVLFPGDPLRAKYIANNFLSNPKEVTNVRNVLGYTGTYNGTSISVMASGMGIPSCSIYATELINNFGVENIIRIGTAGGLPKSNLKLNDIVLAMGACTDSNVNRIRFNDFDFAAVCDFNILHTAYMLANEKNIKVKVGNCFTSDYFYTSNPERYKVLSKLGVLCIEMEAAGLYGVAYEHKANAIAILTITDIIESEEKLTSIERETGLNNMVELSLETAIKL